MFGVLNDLTHHQIVHSYKTIQLQKNEMVKC